MGRANRERRRMKEKSRKRAHAGRPAGGPSAWYPTGPGSDGWSHPWLGQEAAPTLQDRVQALVDSAVFALSHGDDVAVAGSVARLTSDQGSEWRRVLERTLDDCLKATIGRLWQHGWQPVDVLRVAARRLKAPHLHLLRSGIAAELAGYAPTTVDQRWPAQLAESDVAVWWPREQSAVQACGRAHPGGWADFVSRALELLHLLACLPQIELLGPAPGTAVAGPSAAAGSQVDERILARVRALLAKAESTNFPAEAETFTAGAQALMARHSIDHALLAAAGRSPADQPTGRRIGIDNPYEAPKATLLDAIAAANRCRSIWSKELGFATVVGFPTDLDHVEVLFTSLLVQATTAVTRDGSRTDRYGRSRTRAYRQSFLLSYATRIRERLSETTRQQTEAAAAEPGGSNLLPVLASRADAVEQATAEMFPQLSFHSAGSAWDREGWASGRAAADLASLSPADQVGG
jgi:hypothetical protein